MLGKTPGVSVVLTQVVDFYQKTLPVYSTPTLEIHQDSSLRRKIKRLKNKDKNTNQGRENAFGNKGVNPLINPDYQGGALPPL
ncbi:MAG: hypothetical protein PWP04_240 [Candidatus Atribacteria bacterium]|nr:hypothetical protein [Candidatus Atribacteria bacterium]